MKAAILLIATLAIASCAITFDPVAAQKAFTDQLKVTDEQKALAEKCAKEYSTFEVSWEAEGRNVNDADIDRLQKALMKGVQDFKALSCYKLAENLVQQGQKATPTVPATSGTPDVAAPKPEVTTSTPEVTTGAPDVVAPKPEVTTGTPEVTTGAPDVAPPKPEVTTSTPEATTGAPDVPAPKSDAPSAAQIQVTSSDAAPQTQAGAAPGEVITGQVDVYGTVKANLKKYGNEIFQLAGVVVKNIKSGKSDVVGRAFAEIIQLAFALADPATLPDLKGAAKLNIPDAKQFSYTFFSTYFKKLGRADDEGAKKISESFGIVSDDFKKLWGVFEALATGDDSKKDETKKLFEDIKLSLETALAPLIEWFQPITQKAFQDPNFLTNVQSKTTSNREALTNTGLDFLSSVFENKPEEAGSSAATATSQSGVVPSGNATLWIILAIVAVIVIGVVAYICYRNKKAKELAQYTNAPSYGQNYQKV